MDKPNFQMRDDLLIADFTCSAHPTHSFGSAMNEINVNAYLSKQIRIKYGCRTSCVE